MQCVRGLGFISRLHPVTTYSQKKKGCSVWSSELQLIRGPWISIYYTQVGPSPFSSHPSNIRFEACVSFARLDHYCVCYFCHKYYVNCNLGLISNQKACPQFFQQKRSDILTHIFCAEEGLSARGFQVTRLNTYYTVKSQTSMLLKKEFLVYVQFLGVLYFPLLVSVKISLTCYVCFSFFFFAKSFHLDICFLVHDFTMYSVIWNL